MHQGLDWIALSFANGLGLKGYWRLIEIFNHPSDVFSAGAVTRKKKSGLRDSQLLGINDYNQLRDKAEKELYRLREGGACAISYDCPEYPSLLKEIPDPPPVIYLRGNSSLLKSSNISIVGSRVATSYGLRIAHNLAKDLASNDISVCSGLALGIDTKAHEGTLAAFGSTIAVLGCGLDVIYPPQNKKLYQEIVDQGAVITEYSLGTRPDAFRFPARNRIIAGVSQGVVVVEAAKKSGSLITAQMALDFGRDVFAVPGQVDSVKSEGTHWLLKQGAKLVQNAEDVLEELWPDNKFVITSKNTDIDLPPEAQMVLSCLDVYPMAREKLMETSKMSAEKISSLLLLLELEDLVEILPGDVIRRV
ncbi:MAG: DNA-processing protein DprA [Desulfotalea sp.]